MVGVALERSCADSGKGGGDVLLPMFLFVMFNFILY